jgi:hypothetical protein
VEFIPNFFRYQNSVVIIIPQNPAMPLDLFERESNMINKLLGAAAMAAVVVFAVAPASAAKRAMGGCGGDYMMNVDNQVEAMADGDAKTTARKEVVAAQSAMLDGHVAACGMHMNKAEHMSMSK